MKYQLILLFAQLALVTAMFYAGVTQAALTATLDRTEIASNETLTLTVSLDNNIDTNLFNTGELNQDFEVLGVSPRSQTQIVNGARSDTTSWQISLMPKRTGTLIVPAFSINGETTQPIRVQVRAAPTNIKSGADFEVALETDRTSAFVGEQIKITVRVVASDQIIGLSRYDLNLEGVDLELLAQNQFTRLIDGRSYSVVELVYSAFATRAGELRIPPQRLVGSKRTARRDFFGRGQAIRARTKETTVTINEPPSDKPWFAASDVQIQAQWANDKNEPTVGEPITRNIQIVAKGQYSAAIPPLSVKTQGNFKTYDDQPQLQDQKSDDGIIGIRTESLALVPTRAGDIELPETVVDWWDINQGQWRQAILPAETLTVRPGNAAISTTTSQSTPALADLENPDLPPVSGVASFANTTLSTVHLAWFAGVVTVLLSLCGWLLFDNHRLRRRLEEHTTSQTRHKTVADSELKHWKNVQRAVAAKQPSDIRTALLKWTQSVWPDAANNGHKVVGLRPLASKIESADLADLVEAFDSAMFGQSGNDSPTLHIATQIVEHLSRWRKSNAKQQNRRHQREALPTLYPQT